eukprot:2697113-Prorocentrum_lima.AAC.1
MEEEMATEASRPAASTLVASTSAASTTANLPCTKKRQLVWGDIWQGTGWNGNWEERRKQCEEVG